MAASSCSGAFLHENLKFSSASMRKLIIYPSTAELDPALCHEHRQTRGSQSQVTGKSSMNWGFVLLKNGRQLKMKGFVQMYWFSPNLTQDKVGSCWERRQRGCVSFSVSCALLMEGNIWCSGPSAALWEVIFKSFFCNGVKPFTRHLDHSVTWCLSQCFLPYERWMLLTSASGILSE